MKTLVLIAGMLLGSAVGSTIKAQKTGLCTGMNENAAAGKTVEKSTGGFNPDKMDRLKTDGFRESICKSREPKERPSTEREAPVREPRERPERGRMN
ncbi:hypothetical protein [Filimonas effusa]|uniref:Uncharacterized protein n=1 Tax=Filimonas effusa TaxID=2508721 RepID=A0A4V1M9I6_9BACT|nr:hypothetical protein [Filimonas effusa]RXK81278.1 hypothetical protein ESB13_20290 [Filimonas effusa]